MYGLYVPVNPKVADRAGIAILDGLLTPIIQSISSSLLTHAGSDMRPLIFAKRPSPMRSVVISSGESDSGVSVLRVPTK